MALSCLWQVKTAKKEVNLVQNAIPKSTQYKNKWANGIFEEWQRQRLVKVPIVEVVGLFKNYDFHQVESLETPLVEMSVLSVNYWLTKFVQEVAKYGALLGSKLKYKLCYCFPQFIRLRF